METNNYTEPQYKKARFHCPCCSTFACQSWSDVYRPDYDGDEMYDEYAKIDDLDRALCQYCDKYSLWENKKMISPKILTAPLPHKDMPVSVKEIYEEARNISNDSPRAAAALLRVALEKLTEELGEKEGSLNTRIGNLEKKGLSPEIIKGLDIVRIYANEGGAHSGAIDLAGKDGKEIVNALFGLVNIIIEKTISERKEIEKYDHQIPQAKKEGIKNRDNANQQNK